MYFTKLENMRRVTEIDERIQGGGELTVEDLMFLEFSGRIQGFGSMQDPRIDSLLEGREWSTDLDIVLNSKDANPTDLANKLIETGNYSIIAYNIDKFIAAGANINPTDLANKLIEDENRRDLAYNIDKFIAAGVNPTDLANKLIEDGNRRDLEYNLDKFIAAGVPEEVIRRMR